MFTCMQCQESKESELVYDENGNAKVPWAHLGYSYNSVHVGDDEVYSFTCKNDHPNLVYVSNFKFEMLFESGINAMLDGYFAESVLTLTSALERTHETFIDMVTFNKAVPEDLYQSAWKLVSSQSERQLGAFYFLHLNHIKTMPPEFKMASFRNKVIHKGKMPTAEEADKYARHVYDLIKQIYFNAATYLGLEKTSEYLQIRYRRVMPKLQKYRIDHPFQFSQSTLPTMISRAIVIDQYLDHSYEAALKKSKYWKEKNSDPIKAMVGQIRRAQEANK